MKFKGRIGWGVLLLLSCINIFTFQGMLEETHGNMQDIILCCLIFGLIDLMFLDFSIRNHTIVRGDGEIEVRLGVFKQTIQCKDIKSIKKTRNPLSSMSLSLKRQDIDYMGGRVLISIKEEEKFFEVLKKKNPGIIIK